MSEPPTLDLGFIGGSISSAVGQVHVGASRLDGRWRLAAGCFSREADDNRASGERYGVTPERIYDSAEQLLAQERNSLDAVVILTPTPDHASLVAACLEADVPVICEKALATSSQQARELLELRRERNGFLAVTYNYSGYPMLRELRDRIARGVLGDILHIRADMPQEGYVRVDAQGNPPRPQAWRLRDGAIPTLHLDLGVHLHQLIRFLTGSCVQAVVAEHASLGHFQTVVDDARCLLRYEQGVRGSWWFSKSALGYRNGLSIEICGSAGSARWYQMNPEILEFNAKDGTRTLIDRGSSDVEQASLPRYTRFKAGHPAGYIEAFANVYVDIADRLLAWRDGADQSEDYLSDAWATDGLRVLEAMCASVRSGGWCPVREESA